MERQELTITIKDKRDRLSAFSLISALQDTLGLLREVNRDINQRPVSWFIAAAQMNSPFTATFAGEAEQQIVRPILNGLRQIKQEAVRPAYYTYDALQFAKKLVSLYLDGIASIEFSAPREQAVRLTFQLADNIDSIIAKERKPYEVETELEGRLESISAHGANPNFHIFDPITDRAIECTFAESELSKVADLIKRRARVRVSGVAMFSEDDRPKSIKVEGIIPLPDQSELPQIRDLHAAGVNITDGMDSVLFVRGLRDAE